MIGAPYMVSKNTRSIKLRTKSTPIIQNNAFIDFEAFFVGIFFKQKYRKKGISNPKKPKENNCQSQVISKNIFTPPLFKEPIVDA